MLINIVVFIITIQSDNEVVQEDVRRPNFYVTESLSYSADI